MEGQMRLPSSVRRQAERARELERGSGTEQPPDGEADTATEASEQKADRQTEERTEPRQPEKQTDARESDPAYWKQRFSSTMGILRREREERVAAERRLMDEIAALKAELAKSRQTDLSDYLTAEQIEELGETKALELVEIARKVAGGEVKRLVEETITPLQERQRAEQESRRRELANRFHDDLTEAVPGWQDINKTEEWLSFLGDVDERTGLVRQEIVDIAQSRWDAKPIISLLREHLAQIGRSQPQSQPRIAPASTASSGGSADIEQGAAKRPMSAAELKRRYTEIAINKRLSEKERMKQLAELDELYRQSQALR